MIEQILIGQFLVDRLKDSLDVDTLLLNKILLLFKLQYHLFGDVKIVIDASETFNTTR